MSLVTNDYNHALSYAYNKAAEYGIPMEVYSRIRNSEEIEHFTDTDLQYIATPNISDEIPDNWKLEVVIGIVA